MRKKTESHKILPLMSPSDKERFRSKVDVKTNEECWEWTDTPKDSGYGRISVGGRKGVKLLAHRVAKTLAIGEDIPEGLVVMHTCDNPICCNPTHLELGTQLDNNKDKANKGRAPVVFGNTKVDWDIVDEIRTSSLSGKDLCDKYDVSKATISMIRTNKIWKEENRKQLLSHQTNKLVIPYIR